MYQITGNKNTQVGGDIIYPQRTIHGPLKTIIRLQTVQIILLFITMAVNALLLHYNITLYNKTISILNNNDTKIAEVSKNIPTATTEIVMYHQTQDQEISNLQLQLSGVYHRI